jgi:DNA polymerase-1
MAPRKTTDFQIGWAVHQMKSGPDYRSIIVAPHGHSIVEFDAAGQEFRFMALISGDTTMLHLCRPGEDPHSFMGSRADTRYEYRELIKRVAEEDKEAKRIRKGGKVLNLSLQYRTSPKTLRTRSRVDHGMDMTPEQAQHNYYVYHRTYPGVKVYHKTAIEKTQQCGYAETLAGRRVQVIGDWDRYGWQLGSTAINYPVQGTGACQKYLAIRALSELYTELGARFMLDLHDGLFSVVPDHYVSEFCDRGKRILDNLPYGSAWGYTPSIPLPWDVKVGKSWGALHEVKL